MDEFVYQSISRYFHILGIKGYLSYRDVSRLLVLLFYHHLIYDDYRGYISEEDYTQIGVALNCLYGSTCLIPYPDYLKMGKLKLGELTELAYRTKSLESYDEELDRRILKNDALIADNIRRIDEHGHRLDSHDSHLSAIDTTLSTHGSRLTTLESQSRDHDERLTAVENTKVIKGNNYLQDIPTIDLSGVDVIPNS
jgi:hypothetical protein